ncbi:MULTISPECIES: heme exporter protein CcmD [Lysobacteraceae]|uniref:Heme exporter protein D n=1 Tax=Novilysobacter avium TaxID=2781023 RepID=A0A7S6ZVE7_9GAMM|nr:MULTISPECIES: heme exporter protein CcmD [Lysobacter]QOW23103.1 heme exporter protein CcmD [Lysobacter avium]QOW25576.1 heme exporter protein CcmD [Lysobacter sp. H23M47]
MSYLGYVVAAYAVFVVVLGGEFLASWLQVRRELRNARRRVARQAAARAHPVPPSVSNELIR